MPMEVGAARTCSRCPRCLNRTLWCLPMCSNQLLRRAFPVVYQGLPVRVNITSVKDEEGNE